MCRWPQPRAYDGAVVGATLRGCPRHHPDASRYREGFFTGVQNDGVCGRTCAPDVLTRTPGGFFTGVQNDGVCGPFSGQKLGQKLTSCWEGSSQPTVQALTLPTGGRQRLYWLC